LKPWCKHIFIAKIEHSDWNRCQQPYGMNEAHPFCKWYRVRIYCKYRFKEVVNLSHQLTLVNS